jgi:nucleoside-diphosphate-sugar epimerase
MKEKVLITGASGFVGFHLVETAKSAGLEVHAAVRRSSSIAQIEHAVDKFVYLDYEDDGGLISILEENQYQYVIHAAAMTRAKDEKDLLRVNKDYTLKFFSALFAANIPLKRVTFVSSLAAIGPIAMQGGVITERTGYNPVTAYGRSKRETELTLKEKFADKPVTIIRPTAVYGPREKDIFVLFKTLNSGVDAYIGRKPQQLSFIFVTDLAKVILQACLVTHSQFKVYNISDGNIYGRYEMANIFRNVLNRKAIRIHIPFFVIKQIARLFEWAYKRSPNIPVLYPERLNELTAANWGCDVSAARRELGFDPQYDLKKGLAETLVWYKENKWL